MRLLSSPTSPFCRKVLVCALARDVSLNEVFVDTSDPALHARNPLGQVPALETDGGAVLFDSDVIVHYLDTCHDGPPLFGSEPFAAATSIHLSNGLMEAVLFRFKESRRPDGERSSSFIAHLEARIARIIAALEHNLGRFREGSQNAPALAAVCALDYVDFRYRDHWRARHDALASWHASHAARHLFAVTAPTRTAPVSAPMVSPWGCEP